MDIRLPNYSTKDVTDSYIHNLASISYSDDIDHINNDHQKIMMAIFLKYPDYVHLKDDDLSDDQIMQAIINEENQVPALKSLDVLYNINDYPDYKSHKENYEKSIKKIIDIVFRRYDYKCIVYHETHILSDKEIVQQLLKRNTIKHIKFMYDCKNKNIIKLDSNYIQYSLNTIKYTKHPYGYKDNMTTIDNMKSLIEELKHNTKNIYVNCDIIITKYKPSFIIQKIPPQNFATWAIGPKCTKIQRLFDCYKIGHPHVNGWAIEHLISTVGLFTSSTVTDLSDMHFYSCKNAIEMMYNCKELTRAPKLYNIEYCDELLSHTKVTDIDECIVNTENIKSMRMAFCDITCDNVLNNRVFNNLTMVYLDELLCGMKSKRAFNNCTFTKLNDIRFSNDQYYVDVNYVFNDCIFRSPVSVELMDRGDCKIKHLFNNCTYRKNDYGIKELYRKETFVLFIKSAESVLENVDVIYQF